MSLAVLDWRRRVHELYAEVRAAADPAAHQLWRAGRDDLFAHHPASPLLPDDRASFNGLPYAPYDPAMRFDVTVDTDVEPARLDVPTGTDGIVPFERIGRAARRSRHARRVVARLVRRRDLRADERPQPEHVRRRPLRARHGEGRRSRRHVDTQTGRATLVIDLNFAYNPSCAYDPAWACPLAPPGNVLAVDIGAGELTS